MKYNPGETPFESVYTTPLTIVNHEPEQSTPQAEVEQHLNYPNIDRVVLTPDTLTVNRISLKISRREGILLFMLFSYAQLRGADDPLYFPAGMLLKGLHCGEDIESVYKVVNRTRTRLSEAKLNRNLIDSRRGHGYVVSTDPANLSVKGFSELKLNGVKRPD